MTDDKYAFSDPYTYEGSYVLRNKFDIRNEEQLEQRERMLSAERALSAPTAVGANTPSFLELHQHLFQDIYEWAGQIRTIRISKGQTSFCYPEYIERMVTTQLAAMGADARLDGEDLAIVAEAMAEHVNELNMAHPFRDGNGRHLRLFIQIYLAGKGHRLDFTKVRPNDYLSACVAGAVGDNTPMATLLYKALTRVDGDEPRMARTRDTD